MSRIQGRFQALGRDKRKALIPFITAGDPHPSLTVPLMRGLVDLRSGTSVASFEFAEGVEEIFDVKVIPGVRCTLCWSVETARLARLHNDANILILPARFVSEDEGVEILKTWLETAFAGGRHARRVGVHPARG